jgi:signal transduction histidine kinase/ActR/RegA family two-component response regulator
VGNPEPSPLVVRGQHLDSVDATTLAGVCRSWLQCSPDGVLLLGLDGRIEHMNGAGLAQFDIADLSAHVGVKWLSLWPRAEQAKVKAAVVKAKLGQSARFQGVCPNGQGLERWWDVVVGSVANANNASGFGLLVLFRDITALKAADERQAQSRRLEAIGRLTGGVAHDFNNLLTIVMSASEALVDSLQDDGVRRQLAEVSLEAAERGADLVRRLLAFSRPQPANAQSIDCAEMIATVGPLVRRTIREDIELKTASPPRLMYCRADRAELESALINLCINARDAMPRGGVLEVGVEAVDLCAVEADRLGLRPGGYAVFAVRDTGVGMPQAILDRAIEPFFTTKASSGGTGFGLSTVHGFAERHEGKLLLRSTEGKGATVSLYLPLTDQATQAELMFSGADTPLIQRHILLVEDDEQVRGQAARTLGELGYRISQACDGREALRVLAASDDIDLMMTDLRMPNGMSGRELAAFAKMARPRVKVLFTSGYLEEFAPSHPDRPSNFLAKPYRRAQLAAAVAEALSRYDAGATSKRRRRNV